MKYIKKERKIKMNHFEETIVKFLDALNVDLIRDVRYQGRCYGGYHCVCGQSIKRGYMFKNIRTKNKCIIGKDCLQYVAEYLRWN